MILIVMPFFILQINHDVIESESRYSRSFNSIGLLICFFKKTKKEKDAEGQAPVNTEETTKTIEAPASK